jgi:thiosulfate/3-mercaptopyruvate sulfurtransferase
MRTAALLLALAAAAPAARAQTRLPSIVVSADWLAEHLRAPDVVVLHVAHARQQAVADTAHVPGARFLRYDRIAAEIEGVAVELQPADELRRAFAEAGVSNDSRVVLVGDPMSAARAWATLDWLGLGDRAAVLDGGLAAWRADGHPLSRAWTPHAPGDLAVTPQPERFVDAAWVRARLGDADVALVDARPSREYTGEDGGHDHMKPGHVPGARNLYWEELVVSRTDPRLKPEAELRALFERAGASADRTVVVYCMIGMRASVAYLVSRLLGYETRFYDGSWDDWSRRGLPAVTGEAPGEAPGLPSSR